MIAAEPTPRCMCRPRQSDGPGHDADCPFPLLLGTKDTKRCSAWVNARAWLRNPRRFEVDPAAGRLIDELARCFHAPKRSA